MPVKRFTLQQCIYSRTLDKNDSRYCGPEDAAEIGGNAPGKDYTPDKPHFAKDVIITNIKNVMTKCVNPIQDRFPDLIITSVYRSKTLNEYIKGAEGSQHTFGYAADILSINTFETHEIFNWVIDQGMDFDQMIWEFPESGKGLNGSWVHISYKTGNNRKKTTLASSKSDLHDRYGGVKSGTQEYGWYQSDIKRAYPEYLLEKSENAVAPVSKHPNADQVEPNRGYYNKKTGPFNQITVKDDDMNIIYTGKKSSGSIAELIQEAKIALKTY